MAGDYICVARLYMQYTVFAGFCYASDNAARLYNASYLFCASTNILSSVKFRLL